MCIGEALGAVHLLLLEPLMQHVIQAHLRDNCTCQNAWEQRLYSVNVQTHFVSGQCQRSAGISAGTPQQCRRLLPKLCHHTKWWTWWWPYLAFVWLHLSKEGLQPSPAGCLDSPYEWRRCIRSVLCMRVTAAFTTAGLQAYSNSAAVMARCPMGLIPARHDYCCRHAM